MDFVFKAQKAEEVSTNGKFNHTYGVLIISHQTAL